MFSPTQEQFDHAFDILEAYRKATEEDRKGAVMFGDEMIDEASRKMAIKFVSRGERAGLTRSAELGRPRSSADVEGLADQAAGDHLRAPASRRRPRRWTAPARRRSSGYTGNSSA